MALKTTEDENNMTMEFKFCALCRASSKNRGAGFFSET